VLGLYIDCAEAGGEGGIRKLGEFDIVACFTERQHQLARHQGRRRDSIAKPLDAAISGR